MDVVGTPTPREAAAPSHPSWSAARIDRRCQLHGPPVAQRPLGSPDAGKPLFRVPQAQSTRLRGLLGTGLTPPTPALGAGGPHPRLGGAEQQRPPDRRALPAQPASPSAPSHAPAPRRPERTSRPTSASRPRCWLGPWRGLCAVLLSKDFLISTLSF